MSHYQSPFTAKSYHALYVMSTMRIDYIVIFREIFSLYETIQLRLLSSVQVKKQGFFTVEMENEHFVNSKLYKNLYLTFFTRGRNSCWFVGG